MTMSERELERQAARLGRDEAAGLDVERVTARVLEQLRTGDRIRTPVRWRRVAAAAAAALVLAAGTLVWRGAGGASPEARIALAPVPLEELDAPVLAEVLDSLTLEAPAADLVARPTLDDLDEGQLRALLAMMEG